VLALAWLVLSLQTGLNHHLFPLATAGIPTALHGIFGTPPLRNRAALAGAAAGFAVVWVTWLIFVAIDETPTATIFHGQPGGAFGEAVMLSVLGALGGYLWNRSR